MKIVNGKKTLPSTNVAEPKPFIKWAGGKRQLIDALIQHSPKQFGDYYEPFLGGGALFFKLSGMGKITKAYLNDSSKSLIEAYKVIQEKPFELIDELKSGKYLNEKETFYAIRKENPVDAVKATARFIYLNRTAFNGLYRVNSKGQFNVPFGKYGNPKILDEQNIMAVSKALRDVELTCIDFEHALATAKRCDFVYLDPPYHPISDTSYFTSYTKEDFTKEDQERLAKQFMKLHEMGCYVMLSNSYAPLILDLYKDFLTTTKEVTANRMINCKAEGRGKIKEVLITNY